MTRSNQEGGRYSGMIFDTLKLGVERRTTLPTTTIALSNTSPPIQSVSSSIPNNAIMKLPSATDNPGLLFIFENNTSGSHQLNVLDSASSSVKIFSNGQNGILVSDGAIWAGIKV